MLREQFILVCSLTGTYSFDFQFIAYYNIYIGSSKSEVGLGSGQTHIK